MRNMGVSASWSVFFCSKVVRGEILDSQNAWPPYLPEDLANILAMSLYCYWLLQGVDDDWKMLRSSGSILCCAFLFFQGGYISFYVAIYFQTTTMTHSLSWPTSQFWAPLATVCPRFSSNSSELWKKYGKFQILVSWDLQRHSGTLLFYRYGYQPI